MRYCVKELVSSDERLRDGCCLLEWNWRWNINDVILVDLGEVGIATAGEQCHDASVCNLVGFGVDEVSWAFESKCACDTLWWRILTLSLQQICSIGSRSLNFNQNFMLRIILWHITRLNRNWFRTQFVLVSDVLHLFWKFVTNNETWKCPFIPQH